jgi:hypothetical protein
VKHESTNGKHANAEPHALTALEFVEAGHVGGRSGHPIAAVRAHKEREAAKRSPR